MMTMKLRQKEDPFDMLTRSDDLAYDLSQLDTVVPERMTLQHSLEGLSAVVHVEISARAC